MDAVGDLAGALDPGVLQQQGELVAAQAGHRVALAGHRPQAGGHLHQQLVARGVPEPVVDVLEVVQVAEHHRQLARAAAAQGVVQAVAEQPAVGQPGQRVVQGLVGQLALQLHPGGDVAQGQHQPPDAGVGEQVGERALDVHGPAVGTGQAEPDLGVGLGAGVQQRDQGLGVGAVHPLVDRRPDQVGDRHAEQTRGRVGGVGDPPVGAQHDDDVGAAADQAGQAALAGDQRGLLGDLGLQPAVPADQPAEPDHPADGGDDQHAQVGDHGLHVQRAGAVGEVGVQTGDGGPRRGQRVRGGVQHGVGGVGQHGHRSSRGHRGRRAARQPGRGTRRRPRRPGGGRGRAARPPRRPPPAGRRPAWPARRPRAAARTRPRSRRGCPAP